MGQALLYLVHLTSQEEEQSVANKMPTYLSKKLEQQGQADCTRTSCPTAS